MTKVENFEVYSANGESERSSEVSSLEGLTVGKRISKRLSSTIADSFNINEEDLKNICSLEGLRNPVILNILFCVVVGIPCVVLFLTNVEQILEFVIDHATFFQVIGALLKLMGKIFYILAFLPFGTLYKFAIGLLDIDSNLLTALIYQLVSTAVEIVAFQFHRTYGKLPDVKELSKVKQKLKMFSASMEDDEESKFNLNLSAAKKVLEIFLIQNCWGMPDTGTTIYFATATNWSLFLFSLGTLGSNLSVGLLKGTAWIIALRQVQEKIENDADENAWEMLTGLDEKLSATEKGCLLIVGLFGGALCVWRLAKFFWVCCLKHTFRNKEVNKDNVEMGREICWSSVESATPDRSDFVIEYI